MDITEELRRIRMEKNILFTSFNIPKITVKNRNLCIIKFNNSCNVYWYFCSSSSCIDHFMLWIMKNNLQDQVERNINWWNEDWHRKQILIRKEKKMPYLKTENVTANINVFGQSIQVMHSIFMVKFEILYHGGRQTFTKLTESRDAKTNFKENINRYISCTRSQTKVP